MNNDRSKLFAVMAFAILLSVLLVTAQAQRAAKRETTSQRLAVSVRRAFPRSLRPNASSLTPAGGSSLPVSGSGTAGRLTKWTGFTGSISVIGDTTIFEDKFGNVGIGTDSPTAKLTVNGTIQASGGTSILHDMTLMGNGTSGSPLGIASPLELTGNGGGGEVLRVSSLGDHGVAIVASGGDSSSLVGGTGVQAKGGNGVVTGGPGVETVGGLAFNGAGGFGVSAVGGNARGVGNQGGTGIFALGGAGLNGAIRGLAGEFAGDVEITGDLKTAGLFVPAGEENLRIIRGAVDMNGNVLLGSGFTVQQGQPAHYIINFNTPFSAVPVVTISADVGFAHITCTASTCSVLTLNTVPNAASLGFNFIAAGPR